MERQRGQQPYAHTVPNSWLRHWPRGPIHKTSGEIILRLSQDLPKFAVVQHFYSNYSYSYTRTNIRISEDSPDYEYESNIRHSPIAQDYTTTTSEIMMLIMMTMTSAVEYRHRGRGWCNSSPPYILASTKIFLQKYQTGGWKSTAVGGFRSKIGNSSTHMCSVEDLQLSVEKIATS